MRIVIFNVSLRWCVATRAGRCYVSISAVCRPGTMHRHCRRSENGIQNYSQGCSVVVTDATSKRHGGARSRVSPAVPVKDYCGQAVEVITAEQTAAPPV